MKIYIIDVVTWRNGNAPGVELGDVGSNPTVAKLATLNATITEISCFCVVTVPLYYGIEVRGTCGHVV